MKNIVRRSLNLFLAFVMIVCSVPLPFVFAADPTVEIVSFMRGPQSDLRSSELLEARLSNYSGNAHELTYKWTNGLSTYLYLYNSHNMYGINDTAGEVSVSSDSTYSGVGYQWASVYGANIDAEDLLGTVTVEVYDKDGNLICSDSHEGTRERTGGTFWNPQYTYHGFLLDSLSADLQPVSIGMFEGDTKNILNLLGESAIVHITCTACSVSDAEITAGESCVTLSSNGQSITGVAAGTAASVPGDATLSISIGKDNCKFHQYSEADATIPVFVFKKPTTTTAATTLTLTGNFDSRCEYYLDGVKGTEGTDENGDRVVYWTGLTPNTEYEVEVRAKYTDAGGAEKYVYAWVYDTTLPIYTVTVTTLLNDVVTDIDDIHGEEVKLFLGEENAAIDAVHIPLTRTATGTYVTTVGNGTYYLYHQDSDGQPHHQAGTTAVIVNNANATMSVYHYSVGYNTGAGAFNAGENPGTENYAVGSRIIATDKIPVLDGYIFMGWQWSGGTVASGATVTESITAPITLTAIWEKAVNVTVNVIIDHEDENGHLDMDGATKGDVTIELTEKKSGASVFVPTGLTKTYDVTVEAEVTETQHLGHVFSGLHGTSEFAVSVTKSGYDVSYDAPVKDADGNWTITARLKYNFDDFDLAFEVEMDPTVPTELYPKSVNVRIQIFYDDAWYTIDQFSGDVPPIYVAIDPATGKGSGTYPVWKHLPNGDVAKYRIIVTSFTYADGTTTSAVEEVAQVVYGDGNYTATLGGVDDGELCGTVKGAYFDGAAQKGVLDAVVTVEKYDVTFDAQGGTVNGAATDTAEDVYYVPDFDGYVPTRESYVFKGWYEDAECTTPAAEGKLLVADITLYAKWEAVQTVTGVVTVEGTYELNGQTVDVLERDKATKVLVELMEIVGNAENLVASKEVTITYDASGNGVSDEYKFEGLSEEKTYRIYVSVVNYDTAYQNETTASGFNANDYKAVFVADRTKTFVNAHLDFVPEQFELKIKVDATAIGAGFRPASVIAQVLYTIVNSGASYDLISQHVATGGVDIAMTNGKGTGTESVWKALWDGTLYEYQTLISKVDGADPATLPIFINYGDAVRYSPANNAPTGVLKAVLMPKGYIVNFDLNAGTDTVTGMDAYKSGSAYLTHHIWSFDTAITATPVREGYIFKGWKATEDGVYENGKVLAAVAKDVTLVAQWEARSDIVLTVKHVNKDTSYLIDTTEHNVTFGSVITVADYKGTYAGYTFHSTDPVSYTVVLENNVVTVYYTKNEYNYTVKYLEQGTNEVLADETQGTGTYGQVIDLTAKDINGYYVVGSNSATLTIDMEGKVYTFYYTKRTDMKVVIQYREYGYPDIEINPDKTIEDLTFGSIVDLNEVEVSITGFTPCADNPDSYTVTEDGKVIVLYYDRNAVGYTVRYWYDGVLDTTATERDTTAKYGYVISTYTDKPRAGFAFDKVVGLPLTVSANAANNVIDVYYSTDTNDDGIPDKYQATVTYKVLNGTWVSTSDSEPIVVWFTLKEKDANGVWNEVAPKPTLGATIPSATPNTGYDSVTGKWHPEITANTQVNGNEVYVFTYGLNKYTISASVENGYALNADNSAYSVKLVDHSDTETTVIRFEPKSGYAIFSITIDGGARDITPATANTFNVEFDHLGDHHIAVVYELDRNNDGIADKYQKRITFKVVNGTWADGTTANKTVVVNLMTDGKFDVNGSGTLTAPTGMIADIGYVQASGAWDVTPPTTVNANTRDTYTYTFADRKQITVHIEVVNGTSVPAPSTTTFYYDASRTSDVVFTPNAKYILESATVNGADVTSTFNGTVTHDFIKDWTIKVVYTLDENGDNIPDKYQKKITFKVVNGTWTDDGSTEIVKYVTLYENGELSANGTGSYTVPASTANSGHKGGSWDNIPSGVAVGTAPETYTYTYLAKKYADYTYRVEHYKQAGDGFYYLADVENITIPNCELNVDGTAFDPAQTDVTAVKKDYGVHFEYVVVPQTKESGTPVYGQQLVLRLYYKAKDYTVTYYVDDAAKSANTVLSTATAIYGQDITVRGVPHKNGYVFGGWKCSIDSLIKEAGSTYIVEGNVEFVGQWTVQTGISYKIQYIDKATGEFIKDPVLKQDAHFGQTVNYLPFKADIPGYTFNSASPENLIVDTDYTTNVINIYYDINEYNVEYDVNGGVNSGYYDAETVNYKTRITVKDAPVREGYSFLGWKADGVDYAVGQSHIVVADIKFVAQWQIVSGLAYTVNYLEKGTNAVLNPAKVVDGRIFGDVITSADEVISITGYNFDSADKATLSIGVDNASNVINLYYVKGSFGYTVEYYYDGVKDDTATVTANAEFGSVISTYTDKVKTGYKLDKAEGTPLTITAVAANNVIKVYYVKVSGLTYTVNYLEKGTNAVLSPAKVVDGKTFGDIVKAADEAIAITGYAYDSASVAELTIGTDNAANVINLYYTATTAGYTVEHYLYNDASGAYELKDSESLTADIGATVAATPGSYAGYVFDNTITGTVESGTVAADGSLVLKLYYDLIPASVYEVTVKYVVDPEIRGTLSIETETITLTSATEVITIGGSTVTPVSGWRLDSWTDAASNEIGDDNTLAPFTVTANAGDVLVFTANLKVRGTPFIPTPVNPTVAFYRVEHYKWNPALNAYDIADSEVKRGLIGNTVTAEAMSYEGYVLNLAVDGTVASGKVFENIDEGVHTKMLVLKLYYDKDSTGDDTPDIYQKKVVFRIMNGKWADGSTADKVFFLELKRADGTPAPDGSAALTAPAGMSANAGFENGYWDVFPPATVSGTDEVVYTYIYTKIVVPEVPDTPVEPDEPSSPATGDGKALLFGAMALASVIGMAKGVLARKRRED